jgi:hypothetical protein
MKIEFQIQHSLVTPQSDLQTTIEADEEIQNFTGLQFNLRRIQKVVKMKNRTGCFYSVFCKHG